MAKKRDSAQSKPRATTGGANVRQRAVDPSTHGEAEFFRALTENALDGILVLNSDGTVRYQSPFGESTLGRKPGDRVGKSMLERIHPEDAPNFADAFARLAQKPGSTATLNLRLQHGDGSWRLVEGTARSLLDDPAVNGFVVNFHDITERAMAEAMPIPMMISRKSDGTILFANEHLGRLVGVPAGGGVGGKTTDFFYDLADRKAIRDTLASDGYVDNYEFRIKRADGTVRWVVTSSQPLTYRGDEAYLSGFYDITERKQAEDAMRSGERYFRALMENSLDSITVLNADGTLRWESPSASPMLGYDEGQAVGKTSFELIHPDDMPMVTGALPRLLQNPAGIEYLELRIKHNDGSWRTLEVVARNLLHDPIVGGIVVNQRDVTERKEAEEAQRRKEAYYRSLLENAMEAIAVVNRDGLIAYESPSYNHVLGRDPTVAVGTDAFNFIHSDDLPKVAETFAQLLENPGGAVQAEVRALHNDGSYRTLEIVGTNLLDDPAVGGIVANFRDITERKQAEEALRESEEKFRSLAENSPNMIFIYKSGRVVYVNRECERLMGYGRKEFCSPDFDFATIIAPECLGVVRAALGSHMKGEEVPPYEYTLITKGGERIEALLTTALMRYEGETSILGAVTDITERKQAEHEMRGMDEQRHLTARLATVGQLAAGVAHELNNPLAAVQGFAQLLTDREDLEESIRSDVECIYNEAKRATKITANLLSFARKHRPEKRLISINDVVEKSLELHAYRMRVNNVEMETQLAADLPATMADFHQIQQVLVNIITNAEQAMTEAHGKGKLCVQSQWAGDTIKVTLADDGPGIPQADLDRIFEPFYTTKEVGQGTGLGLDICRGIVERHGGRMYAASAAGGGTTFVIEIPVVSEAQTLAEQEDSASIA